MATVLPEKFFIHLLGKQGVGKSSTGNSVLGREAFFTKSSLSIVTDEVQIATGDFKEALVKVVDGPGLVNKDFIVNNASIQEYRDVVLKNMNEFHYFILIFRYADPIVFDDRAMINALKKNFGSNFFRNNIIIAITSGDCFHYVNDNHISFEEWCLSQRGLFSEVYSECGGRALLIDNSQQMTLRHSAVKEALPSLLRQIGRTTSQGVNLSRERPILHFLNTVKQLLYQYRFPITTIGLSVIAYSIWKPSFRKASFI